MTLPAPELPETCWPLDPGCLGDEWEAYDPELQDRAAALAVQTLRRLTAGRVGGCPVKVRPIPQNGCQGLPLSQYPFSGGYSTGWGPYLQVDGSITNCGCGSTNSCELKLPDYVGRVDEVKIDGVVVPPSDYAILDHSSLVWRGTWPCRWPKSQDLGKADTEVGTHSVTYLAARPVDLLGAVAAGTLANEYAKACSGGKGCRLPKGVQSVVRTGVSYTINVTGLFPGNRTGIDDVDRWLAIWNPGGVLVAPTVWSPDQPKVRYE